MPDDNAQSFVSSLQDAPDETERQVKLLAGVPAGFVLPAVAAAASPSTIHPGVERWLVKTGTDPDVAKVGKTGVVDTTVEELISIPRPKDFQPPNRRFAKYDQKRSAPVETTVWRLEADIIALKLEGDGDYHLVLQGDSGETMIGEIPDPEPAFVKTTSPYFADIKTSRQAADQRLLKHVSAAMALAPDSMLVPKTAMVVQPPGPGLNPSAGALTEAAGPAGGPLTFKTKIPPQRARITGVGFFDEIHGQMGVSQFNGIELHPILKIQWL